MGKFVAYQLLVIFTLSVGFGIFAVIATIWKIFDAQRQNRWRFSLRSLLIVTTALALLFGILSALIRWPK
jgi:hypothetical protein